MIFCVCVCVSKIEDTGMNAQSGPHCVSMFAQENTKSSAKSFPVLTFQISTASVNPFASWPVAGLACYVNHGKLFLRTVPQTLDTKSCMFSACCTGLLHLCCILHKLKIWVGRQVRELFAWSPTKAEPPNGTLKQVNRYEEKIQFLILVWRTVTFSQENLNDDRELTVRSTWNFCLHKE